MKDLGRVKKILGIEIERDKETRKIAGPKIIIDPRWCNLVKEVGRQFLFTWHAATKLKELQTLFFLIINE